MNTEQERAAFEKFMSNAGKFPQAIERDEGGDYVLMHAASSWHVWQARAALQSQDREQDRIDAERYRWLRADNAYFPEENYIRGGQELDEAIDHARRVEENK